MAEPLAGSEADSDGCADPDCRSVCVVVAVVVVAIWLIGALVLAALWTERAEIAG